MGQIFAVNDPLADRAGQTWLGLSGKGLLDPMITGALTRGSFVIEFDLPLPSGTLILDCQSQDITARSFGIFYDPAAGIAILHREGAVVAKHRIAGPLPLGDGTGQLRFHFDGAAWQLHFQILGGAARSAQGVGALPIDYRDMAMICTQARSHAAVLWFGFSSAADLPQAEAWIGHRTMVQTSLGMVAAGNLRAGDVIMTDDLGPMPLRSVRHMQLPARGSFAPVLLRAPFFGVGSDLLVSSQQQILINSGEVEYLFGTEAALIAAQDFVDGRTALLDDRRTVTAAVELDLGCAALIDVGGLQLVVGQEAGFDDYPILKRFEAVTLTAMMRGHGAQLA